MADVTPATRWLEAENAVIGALLLDERLASPILAAVDPADICDDTNRSIYQAARSLLLEGKPVDPFTIRSRAGSECEKRILQLMEITPTASNWQAYASIMHEQASLARIRDLAHDVMGEPTVDGCRPKIAALSEIVATGKGVEAWSMGDAYRHFMAAQDSAVKREYISYGIRELDEGTYTEPGDVVVLAGEPSSGKTLLALLTAYNMAKTRNVGFFSLETNPAKLTDRLVAAAIDVDFNAIKRQQLLERDWQRVAAGGQDFTSRRLTLIRGAGMTASQIQAVSRSYGFEVIFVDYVQLIMPETDPRLGQTQAMATISRSMHMFAQASGTLVVELSQLARPQKQGGWKEPTMHDLKETGQLEQDADLIMLLFKPRPGEKIDDVEVNVEKMRILKIDKQKEGRLGKWPMYFDGSRQRMTIMAGPDGEAVMRHFANKAKAKKAKDAGKAGSSVPGQVKLEEVPETGDEPL